MKLTLDNISLTYTHTTAGRALPVLQNISATIPTGQFVAILGPSGCGKSTLIRVLAGLQHPGRGRVLLQDRPLQGASPDIGMMFQDASLMPWRTVFDNVALPLEMNHQPKPHNQQLIHNLLYSLGLHDFAQAYPAELSGGMAQRVALARVLVQNPRLLLLDEPFGALDAFTREQISLDLLRLWASQKQTCLMVTHNITEAVFMADRIFVLTQRPASIRADMLVNLPRPRTLDMIYQPDFIDIARRVRTHIDQA